MSGAVTVLFLFVIIMLNLQLAELNSVGSEYTQNLPLGAIIGSVFVFELLSILPSNGMLLQASSFYQTFYQVVLGVFTRFNSLFLGNYDNINSSNVHLTFNSVSPDVSFSPLTGLQIQSIGSILYTYGAVWLVVASVILLLAIIAPITLSMNKQSTSL